MHSSNFMVSNALEYPDVSVWGRVVLSDSCRSPNVSAQELLAWMNRFDCRRVYSYIPKKIGTYHAVPTVCEAV